MKYKNYAQIKAMRESCEKRITKACPLITNNSGIYIFHRDDESGLHFAYVGQAKHLRERCASHLLEYDRIALSLKKRGFYSDENPYGWKLTFKEYSIDELDEHERATILSCANKGYQLYNVTAGGQGAGKVDINERKPSKTYRDGVEYGRSQLAKELLDIINKHLTIDLKENKKDNKVSQNALNKFWKILEEGKG